MDLKTIENLCHRFNYVRGELRLVVQKENLSALRTALEAAQYGISQFCEDFTPGFYCVRAN